MSIHICIYNYWADTTEKEMSVLRTCKVPWHFGRHYTLFKKLVVAPKGVDYSDDAIRALTEFQEKYFESIIIR